jgi:L-histidine Nalpha-methyltransferase
LEDIGAAEKGGDTTAMRSEVAEGLRRAQKEVSPKFFYDQRGSALFEQITTLPEYYPTRTERALLQAFVPDWLDGLAPRSVVELGAGAADKSRILLEALRRRSPGGTYLPIDISTQFLAEAAASLREDFPALRIRPVAADMTVDLQIPPEVPRPAVFALLGGTIGNFRPAGAAALLRRVRAEMGPADRFLLGADLVKPREVLEAAYNDSAGVTAEFNLNLLHVLNRELDADFDPADFRHHAFYDEARARIEMHLVAEAPVTVTIPGAGRFRFEAGESLRTEISCKYDRQRLEALLHSAGLHLDEWRTHPPGFALVTASPR